MNRKVDRRDRLGLTTSLVYRCNRCNYLWLPRDYDPAYDDIMRMEPPKSCARCKSKYWRQIRVQDRLMKIGGEFYSIAKERAISRRVKKQREE